MVLFALSFADFLRNFPVALTDVNLASHLAAILFVKWASVAESNQKKRGRGAGGLSLFLLQVILRFGLWRVTSFEQLGSSCLT